MKFKQNELYLVGTETHICLHANEQVALLVPVPMTNALLYGQSGMPVTSLEGINTDFPSRVFDGVTFAPSFWERFTTKPKPPKTEE